MRVRVHYAEPDEDGFLGPPLCGASDYHAAKSHFADDTPPDKYIDCKRCLKKLREREVTQ